MVHCPWDPCHIIPVDYKLIYIYVYISWKSLGFHRGWPISKDQEPHWMGLSVGSLLKKLCIFILCQWWINQEVIRVGLNTVIPVHGCLRFVIVGDRRMHLIKRAAFSHQPLDTASPLVSIPYKRDVCRSLPGPQSIGGVSRQTYIIATIGRINWSLGPPYRQATKRLLQISSKERTISINSKPE